MKRFSRKNCSKNTYCLTLKTSLSTVLSKKNVTSSKNIFFSLQKAFSPSATYHFLGDALTFKMFEKLFKTLRNYYR